MHMLSFQQGSTGGSRGTVLLGTQAKVRGPMRLFACAATSVRAEAEAGCVLRAQFPDPHFKNKHKKRRVVQPELVQAVAAHMPPGGDRRAPLIPN